MVKSLIDYFIIDSSSWVLIKDITLWNFDECLSDVHCPVVTPPEDSVVVPELKIKWNMEVQELYTS